ncbi:CDGSH iron-sulfur domain-containing protein [Rothia sp. ARF10]|nr:CDGSH iron-sulfur domain-containing protein [Rothia sp. ARF10]
MSRLQQPRSGVEPPSAVGDGRTARATRVVVTGEGPVLVDGPVEVVTATGDVVRSDRTTVALCTCRRSRTAPFCDTSHRDRVRAERGAPATEESS